MLQHRHSDRVKIRWGIQSQNCVTRIRSGSDVVLTEACLGENMSVGGSAFVPILPSQSQDLFRGNCPQRSFFKRYMRHGLPISICTLFGLASSNGTQGRWVNLRISSITCVHVRNQRAVKLHRSISSNVDHTQGPWTRGGIQTSSFHPNDSHEGKHGWSFDIISFITQRNPAGSDCSWIAGASPRNLPCPREWGHVLYRLTLHIVCKLDIPNEQFNIYLNSELETELRDEGQSLVLSYYDGLFSVFLSSRCIF
jgi:hypothetical protein